MIPDLRRAQMLLSALLYLPSLLVAQDDTHCTAVQAEQYQYAIQQHVRELWTAPYEGRTSNCEVRISQDFRSEVVHVEILNCDDDLRVRKSAEDAAYLASPLPRPPSRACFVSEVVVTLSNA